MRPPRVVFDQPGVEIGLQLVDRVIDLFAERDSVKLVQDSAVEALTDSVRLWALGLGAAVIDVLDREIELVIVALGSALAERALRSAVIVETWSDRRCWLIEPV